MRLQFNLSSHYMLSNLIFNDLYRYKLAMRKPCDTFNAGLKFVWKSLLMDKSLSITISRIQHKRELNFLLPF